MWRGDEIYSGPERKNGPDLIVGLERGYRFSWQTALGATPEELFTSNDTAWSGTHLVDPELVPGILLSNEAIQRDRVSVLDLFPTDEPLCRWIRMAGEKVAFQGLPSRICWLGYGDRAKFGLALNDLVKKGELSAPIVIGRDHLDCGSVASPYRETEAMRDGTDAVAD